MKNTNNFELLKRDRLNLYEEHKQHFIKECKLKKIEITPKELDNLYKTWLKSELDFFNEPILNEQENFLKKVEILQYINFLEKELEAIENYYNVKKIDKNYVNEYLALYRNMFEEHIKIFDPPPISPSQRTINLFIKKLDTYNKGFHNEWQDKLLYLVEENKDVTPYLRKIYLNGFLKLKYDHQSYYGRLDFPLRAQHKVYLNFGHSINLICQEIREFLLLNFKLKISEVSVDGYNISGGYFKEFKVIPIEEVENNQSTKILMLTAIPAETSRINIDKEYSKISEKTQKHPEFTLHRENSISRTELKEKVEEFQPNILHFSGHGNQTVEDQQIGGIALQNEEKNGVELLSAQKLEGLFKYFKIEEKLPVKLVILNCCYSAEQAFAIAKYVPFVIGTTRAINDTQAISFSSGFYYKYTKTQNIFKAFESGKAEAKMTGAFDRDFILYKEGEKYNSSTSIP